MVNGFHFMVAAVLKDGPDRIRATCSVWGPKIPHDHKDPTNHGLWNSPQALDLTTRTWHLHVSVAFVQICPVRQNHVFCRLLLVFTC